MTKDTAKLEFSFTDSINNIAKADWDRLFGEDNVEGWGFHKTIEESGLAEFSFSYLLARRDSRLVCIIPMFTTDFSFTTIIQGPLQTFVLFCQRIFKGFLKFKIIFVGNPIAEKLYLGISPEENLGELINAALKKLNAYARGQKASVLLFYNVTEKDGLLAGSLERNGLKRMENFPNTILDINARSLDEFIGNLGHSTRKDMRRKLRKTLTLTSLETEIREDADGILEEVYKLYSTNFQDSDVNFEILTPDFFRNIAKNVPQKAKFFITRSQGKIVAFNMCLVNKNTCIDKIIGMDREVSKTYNLYYMTFFHNISWCIKNNIRYYVLGITDYHPKIRLGARLVPLYIYARLFNPFLRLFARPLLKFIQPKNFDPTLKHLQKTGETELVSGEKFL
jgi:predicted N-acyltransferase